MGRDNIIGCYPMTCFFYIQLPCLLSNFPESNLFQVEEQKDIDFEKLWVCLFQQGGSNSSNNYQIIWRSFV